MVTMKRFLDDIPFSIESPISEECQGLSEELLHHQCCLLSHYLSSANDLMAVSVDIWLVL